MKSAARVVLIIVLIVQVLTHLAWLPISAHSGQVGIPWMMNQGKVLFDSLLEQHAPGSSVLAAVAQRVFPGEPVLVARALNLMMVLAATALIYAAASRLSSRPGAGLMAALVWFWWEPVYGNVLVYFDSLLGFLLLAAVFCWLTLEKRGPSWLAPALSGLLLGAATIAKQHAWAAAALFAAWMIIFHQPRRRVLVFAMAVLILPGLTIALVAGQGNLQNYLYWNWTFNFSGLMENDPVSGDFLRKLMFTNALAPVFMLLALRPGAAGARAWLISLMWLGGSATLVPRPGEIHAMGQLPLLAVMSGAALVELLPHFRPSLKLPVSARPLDPLAAAALGLLLVTAAAWVWTGAAAYAGERGFIPAHDEFVQLAGRLNALSHPGDTLFILPETDSTPQIHSLSGLLPPGTWVKGWFWYLEAPGMLDKLLSEWAATPPVFIVYFPDMIAEGQPDINTLVEFMNAHYDAVEVVEGIRFHGDALIYRLREER